MREDRLEYIEDFSSTFEQFGVSGIVGRMLGALLVSDPPVLSVESLAELSRTSEDNVTHELHTFVRAGLVVQQRRANGEPDGFRFNPDTWGVLISQQLVSLMSFRRLAERGLALLEPDEEEARRSLEEMRDRYAYAERELPALFERFEKERAGERSDKHPASTQDKTHGEDGETAEVKEASLATTTPERVA